MSLSLSAVKVLLIIASVGLLVTGCGDSPTTSTATTAGNTKFNSAVAAMNSSFSTVGALMPSVAASSFIGPASRRINSVLTAAAPPNFNDSWNGTGLVPHPQCSGGGSDPHCGSNANLETYMSFQVDPDAKRDNGSSINVFGRLKASISQVCALMNLAPNVDANGYPSAGTVSVTFTAAMNSVLVNQCGFASDDIPAEGSTAEFTVNVPGDTTLYDRELALDDGAGSVQTFYFRTNAAMVNILSVEVNANYTSRSIVALDRSTGVLRAEYLSVPSSSPTGKSIEFQRVFLDPTANVANMLSYSRDFNTPANQIAFTLMGRPLSSSAQAAIGFRAGQFGGFAWGTDKYRGCFSQATGAMISDGTLACTGTTGVAADAAGPAGIMTDLDTLGNSGSAGTKINNADATSTLPFNSGASVYTALTSHS